MKNMKYVTIFFLLTTMNEASLAQAITNIERTGDVLQFVMPLAAYGMTVASDDSIGRRELFTSLFATLGATYALKYAVPEKRPNGGEHAFISGHTSLAFAGAAFIQRRYGWKYGIPAYLTAAFVGWSRVYAREHSTADVLRGAAIGILSSYILTVPWHKNMQLLPRSRLESTMD